MPSPLQIRLRMEARARLVAADRRLGGSARSMASKSCAHACRMETASAAAHSGAVRLAQ
jgi:hypothetical protein